jgi:hypothetical protein
MLMRNKTLRLPIFNRYRNRKSDQKSYFLLNHIDSACLEHLVSLTDSTMGEVDSRAFKISPVAMLEHHDVGC